jgi:hypothetical protein
MVHCGIQTLQARQALPLKVRPLVGLLDLFKLVDVLKGGNVRHEVMMMEMLIRLLLTPERRLKCSIYSLKPSELNNQNFRGSCPILIALLY